MRRLIAGIEIDDHSFVVHENRLAEAELRPDVRQSLDAVVILSAIDWNTAWVWQSAKVAHVSAQLGMGIMRVPARIGLRP